MRKNFGGKIVLICRENYLPYDRVKVSKAMDSNIESIMLRNEEFYDENDIEVMLGTSATSLSLETKEIALSNGEKLKYDKVYIATGLSPTKCKFFSAVQIVNNKLTNLFLYNF